MAEYAGDPAIMKFSTAEPHWRIYAFIAYRQCCIAMCEL